MKKFKMGHVIGLPVVLTGEYQALYVVPICRGFVGAAAKIAYPYNERKIFLYVGGYNLRMHDMNNT